MKRAILTRFGWGLVGLSFLFGLADGASAQDADTAALKVRLDQLEQQHQELQRKFDQLKANPSKALEPSAAPESGEKKEPAETGAAKEEKKAWSIGENLDFKVRWNYGLEAETADKAFRVHVGGRLQADAAFIGASDRVMFGRGGIGKADDAVGFRRARLDVEGKFWEQFDFYVQVDFVNTFNVDPLGPPVIAGVPAPTDLWMTFTKLPLVGNFRVGNQKSPISFEHLLSSRFLDFLERSLGFDAFIENQDNGFRPGMQLFNWAFDERMTWAIGVFKNTRNVFAFNVGDGEYDVTGRLTFLPVYEDDGRYLIHLGLGASYADLDDDQERFRARLLIRNGPAVSHNIVAEARMFGDNRVLVVPEFAMVLGPLTIEAEYYGAWVTDAVAPVEPPAARRDRGTFFGQSFYIQALYFLTGEHRRYNRATIFNTHRIAVFDRVIPRENAFCLDGKDGLVLGKGAWQVGLRYSYLDLADKDVNGLAVNGAVVHDMTLGLNWFFNPNSKVQFNYTLAYREANGGESDGFVHAFGTRLAFDF